MLSQYIHAAMNRAQIRWIEDDQVWYGEIPGLTGVWATGETEHGCRQELQEVLEEWIALGLRMGHPIPEVDGVSIVVEAAE